MSVPFAPEPIDAAIAEYLASFESGWKPKTLTKYEAELRGLRAWLAGEGRPLTTASLDFATLLAYASHLKAKPVVRGVWRGDATARATAATLTPRSPNSVNSSMRVSTDGSTTANTGATTRTAAGRSWYGRAPHARSDWRSGSS
jgi:hypothetical protein